MWNYWYFHLFLLASSWFPECQAFHLRCKWSEKLFHLTKQALTLYSNKACVGFTTGKLINRLLVAIIVALVINLAKAVKSPIISVTFAVALLWVCVCAHVVLGSQRYNNQCGETLGLFWASLRGLSRLICNRTCRRKRKKSLNSSLYQHLNPFPTSP